MTILNNKKSMAITYRTNEAVSFTKTGMEIPS
jgi:hypothetical protein